MFKIKQFLHIDLSQLFFEEKLDDETQSLFL